MTSPSVEKIRNYLDLSLVSKFDTNDMFSNSYIPLMIQKGSVYVLTRTSAVQGDVVSTVSSILGTTNITIKMISDSDFDDLFDVVNSSLHVEGAPALDVSASDVSDDIQLKYDDADSIDEDGQIAHPISSEESEEAEDKYFSKKIGEVLVDMGFVSKEQIFNALGESKRQQLPLGTILIQQGAISVTDLKRALTAQQGYESVTEEQLKLSDNIIGQLPEDFIRLNKVIPISYDDKVIVVAMVNPNDKKVINDIIYLTGLKPSILIITHYEFQMCLKNFFNETKKATERMKKKVEKQALSFEREESLFEQAQRELKDDSNIVVKFTNKIISDGIDMKASDIHIEPRIDRYVVRYRKDGILHEALTLPQKSELAILTRLKVISKMNIAEHRRPQDGSFSITYKDRDYDFRINTLPVGDQEKMVIRILAPAVSMA